ncbi:unnamed protein product [Sphagnum troendelagicum]|uniref:GPI-anchored wall transfer protein n=1 Tax=Sphagnum troendelagicum TaxID=128251 RepID=A0ABP0TZB3_9BRYO
MDSPSAFNVHKRLKEEFVSNLHGTTMLEVGVLSAIIPVLGFMSFSFPSHLYGSFAAVKRTKTNGSDKDLSKPSRSAMAFDFVSKLVLDFMVIFVPTLACLTVCLSLATLVLQLLAALANLFCKDYIPSYSQQQSPKVKPSPKEQVKSSQKAYLSSYRFVMMLVTCVTILAVDFTVFPRRYAKTETYGSGLMDIGVGSFVVANALVSRQARNLPPSKYGGVLRNVSPLLILGLARLIVTKGVDYQEHVAEYGVHWNFFFTLAGVALLTSFIHVPPTYCGSLGIAILSVYQMMLSGGLNRYLLSSERGPGFLSLNKEGVASTFGYWGLYLISIQLGHYLNFKHASILEWFWQMSNTQKGGTGTMSQWWAAADIGLLDLALWLLTIYMDHTVERISRRTCNLAYVLFVLAQNFEVIGIFMVADLLFPPKPILVLEVFNHNLLPSFLLANLLTGLVNMSMHTIFVSSSKAFATLLAYLAALVGMMALAEANKLRLKFW